MRDLAGFAILVLILVFGAYLLFQVVLPFLTTYVLGVILFFLFATVIVWRGRLHPVHLDSLLKPGYAAILAVLAVAAPLCHALLVYLFSGNEFCVFIFIANVTLPLLWTSRLLVVHRRQKEKYLVEGHDIEDLIEEARRKKAALDIKSDAMESIASQHHETKPWEMVGDVEPVPLSVDSERLDHTIIGIVDLKDKYLDIVRQLDSALSDVRTDKERTPHPTVSKSRSSLDELEQVFDRVMKNSESLLSGACGGVGAPGWEDS